MSKLDALADTASELVPSPVIEDGGPESGDEPNTFDASDFVEQTPDDDPFVLARAKETVAEPKELLPSGFYEDRKNIVRYLEEWNLTPTQVQSVRATPTERRLYLLYRSTPGGPVKVQRPWFISALRLWQAGYPLRRPSLDADSLEKHKIDTPEQVGMSESELPTEGRK